MILFDGMLIDAILREGGMAIHYNDDSATGEYVKLCADMEHDDPEQAPEPEETRAMSGELDGSWYEPIELNLIAQLRDYMHEHELSEELRAKFIRLPSGAVLCADIEWNDARPGMPAHWVPAFRLFRHLGELLARDVREELDREEREQWDAIAASGL